MRTGTLAALTAVLASGCTTSLGRVPFVAADTTATKLLRPGVEARSCRASVFGVATASGEPSAGEAVAQLTALDEEANGLADAELRTERVTTGVYNRRCVVVRGDLVRTISSVTLPMPEGHRHPH